ncbi:MAG: diguanylate cyclase [Nitrospirota bacterium]
MKRVISIGIGMAALIIVLSTVFSYINTLHLIDNTKLRTLAFTVVDRLELLLTNIMNAEAARQEYIITKDPRHLALFQNATSAAARNMEELKRLERSAPALRAHRTELEALLVKRLANLSESIEHQRKEGFDIAKQRALTMEGDTIYDRIVAVVNEIKQEEKRVITMLGGEQRSIAKRLVATLLSGTFLSILIFSWIVSLLSREISERRKAEDRLSRSVDELEGRGREISFLSEMGRLLQACTSVAEVKEVIARSMSELFYRESGTVYFMNAEGELLESVFSWGGETGSEPAFSPDQCWALRLGRVYTVGADRAMMLCPHITQVRKGVYLCVPMIAQGEALGLLFLFIKEELFARQEADRKRLLEYKQRLAETAAESIALSLANFRLRETLYAQSIRDPLTGLFNRRYLKEMLDREVYRTARREQELCVVMIDIDHFKLFNDRFGHDAGDLLLRELGAFLQGRIRESDFACRYGGEEFVVVLPETPLERAGERAEELRREVKQLTVRYHGELLGPVTLSMGVASFPQHGPAADDLLKAADAALYRAKEEGRDRVVTA